MIQVAGYREGDETRIVSRPGDDWGANAEGVRIMTLHYPAWTFSVEDRIIMILGIWKLWEGNWECWSIPSDDARGHAIAIVRRTRELLRQLPEQEYILRFSAISREDKTEYNKWLEMLGFEVEYVQQKAYDGRLDVIGYRRLA